MTNITPEWLNEKFIVAQQLCSDWMRLLDFSGIEVESTAICFFEQPTLPVFVPYRLNGVEISVQFTFKEYKDRTSLVVEIHCENECPIYLKERSSGFQEKEILEYTLKLLKLHEIKYKKAKKKLRKILASQENFLAACKNLEIQDIEHLDDSLVAIKRGIEIMSLPSTVSFCRVTCMVPYQVLGRFLQDWGVDFSDAKSRLLYRGELRKRRDDDQCED